MKARKDDAQVAWFLEGRLHMSLARDLKRNNSEFLQGPFTADELSARLARMEVHDIYLPYPIQIGHLATPADVKGSAPNGRTPRANDLIIIGDNPAEGARYYTHIIYEEYVPY